MSAPRMQACHEISRLLPKRFFIVDDMLAKHGEGIANRLSAVHTAHKFSVGGLNDRVYIGKQELSEFFHACRKETANQKGEQQQAHCCHSLKPPAAALFTVAGRNLRPVFNAVGHVITSVYPMTLPGRIYI